MAICSPRTSMYKSFHLITDTFSVIFILKVFYFFVYRIPQCYKLQCYWYSVAFQTWYQVYWLVLTLGTVMLLFMLNISSVFS